MNRITSISSVKRANGFYPKRLSDLNDHASQTVNDGFINSIVQRDADDKKRWRTSLNHAKNTWGKLSDEELEHVEGNLHVLVGLIKARYHLPHESAYKQVKQFFDHEIHASSSGVKAKPDWQHHVNAAHSNWPAISVTELARTRGFHECLVSLLQSYYIISTMEANRQVSQFLQQHPIY